jgi:carboxyl-terminal processing protease
MKTKENKKASPISSRVRCGFICANQPLIFPLTLLIASVCLAAVSFSQESAPPNTPDAIIQSAINAIQKHYLRARANPLWNIARNALLSGKYKDSAQAFEALQKQVPYMEDPDLNLLSPDEVAAVQSEALGQKLGLGLCNFCLDLQIETGRARVITALAGSPAMKAGIQPRDVIVSINGEPTGDMSHEEVMDTLQRTATGGVTLQFERGDEELTQVLQPSAAKLNALESSVKRVSGKSIAYIRVTLFTPDLAQQARESVTKLEKTGVDGYVLDLRNNPGGFLNSAKGVAGLFTNGTLGFELRSNGQKETLEAKDPPLTQKPLAVLINGGTASAAEFLSGALQGTHRGVLIGEQSYGRGQAQIFIFLAQGYGIQIPSVELLTPDGQGFNGKGIRADVEIQQPQLPESQMTGPSDKQFLRAVSSLTATGRQ